MSRPKVYISGPITKGCRNHNLHQALLAHEALMRHGFAVFNPMLNMLCPFNHPTNPDMDHGVWLDNDKPWVAASDALLRLDGESVGADMEVSHAHNTGVPVYYDIEQLLTDFHVRLSEEALCRQHH